MGLRDRLKGVVKGIVGGAPAPAAPAPVVKPAPVPSKAGTVIDGYTAIGAASAVAEGKAATWGYKGGVVAVFRKEGKLYAIDNACRHEDGPVGEGTIAGCKVKCPYHDWEYDFTTGECVSNPGNALATYAVRESEGLIWIGPQLTPGTDARGGEHNDGMKVITQ